MTIARRDIILWVVLFGGFGILWGSILEAAAWNGMGDFRAVYSASRTLLHHRDPYQFAILRNEYAAEGGKMPTTPIDLRVLNEGMLRCVNLPTALFLVLPLAALPWQAAYLIWMLLIAAFCLIAAFLILRESLRYASGPPLLLTGILLLDLGNLLFSGNLAGLVTALCAVAAWLLLNDRQPSVAVVCLAVALLLKPHDSGFVWLYFLIAPAPFRKRAVQALALAALAGIPAWLWVSSNAPGWAHEMRANLHADSAPGGFNDPGPSSAGFDHPHEPIDLQAAISVFRNDPGFYNPLSYLIAAGLLVLVWVRTATAGLARKSAWLALGSVSALTMLPVYHRDYDSRLLLLSVPACALVWAGGRGKWLALFLNTLAVGSTAALPFSGLALCVRYLVEHSGVQVGRVLSDGLAQLAPLSMLALSVFYLVRYWRSAPVSTEPGMEADAVQA